MLQGNARLEQKKIERAFNRSASIPLQFQEHLAVRVNARVRKQVTPGDVLTLHCELVAQHGPVGVGKASAWVDGKCAATAELTFVLT